MTREIQPNPFAALEKGGVGLCHFGRTWYMIERWLPSLGRPSGELRMKERLDSRKALETLLYVARRQSNLYCALKLIFYADKEHLARFGRLMFGEHYIAMRAGPVPSAAYDLVKYVRGDGIFSPDVPVKDALGIDGNTLRPLRDPAVEFLSESEIECLEIALKEYGSKTGLELYELSHKERAFREADENDVMSVEVIAADLPDGQLLVKHLLDA